MTQELSRWHPRRLYWALLRRSLGTITHVKTSEPLVALTFDDGPHPEFTPRLLDILERHQARATFFLVGETANQRPDLVGRVAQIGHAIGNHSWDHPSFPYIPGKERRAQIRACQKALAPYGQRLFRPPYGHQSVSSRLDAFWLGYRVVTWNLLAGDWEDEDPGRIAGRLIDRIRPGSVILLHDALHDVLEERYADRGPALQAVDRFLTQLGGRFRCVTVPDLLRSGRPVYQNWYRRGDAEWLNGLERPSGPSRRYGRRS